MAPGQFLIEVVGPILTAVIPIVGGLVFVKKRKTKKEACARIDEVAELKSRVAELECDGRTEFITKSELEEHLDSVYKRIHARDDSIDRLDSAIERCATREQTVDEIQRAIANRPTGQELENQINGLRMECNSYAEGVRNDIQSKIESAVKKIGEESEKEDSRIGKELSVEFGRVIEEKIREYDAAMMKWLESMLAEAQKQSPLSPLELNQRINEIAKSVVADHRSGSDCVAMHDDDDGELDLDSIEL